MTSPKRTPAELLSSWVVGRVPAAAADWFRAQTERLRSSASEKEIYLALGYATRKLGKGDLALKAEERAAAAAARPYWDPSDWSVDQAARIAFVLASQARDGKAFKARLETLFNTADVWELIAFYRGLPLYPEPAQHVARAREGTRSAMQPIFEAVAHRNPFPMEQFDENAWNHMVLKALFIGSKLAPILGLDERANPRLMRMLCDYAHERWAAQRPVSPELWRCVGPYADSAALNDLARVLATGEPLERQAAVLALASSRASDAERHVRAHPDLHDVQEAVRAGKITWSDIARG
jgi:hypothetical protein